MSTRSRPELLEADQPADHDLSEHQSLFSSMQRELAAAKAQLAERHADIALTPPAPFDGERTSQLSVFLTQLRLAFAARPSQFYNDRHKVLYAASLLRGTAFSWIQPYLDMDHPPTWLTDFGLFTAEINKVFGEPHALDTAARSLDNLKQTGSVADYAAKFRRLAIILQWGDGPLTYLFYRDLKDEVKDEIARVERPSDLEALITLAIRIDNRLYERALERNQARRFVARVQPAVPVRSTSAPRSPPTPRPVPTTPNRTRVQQLSEEEKSYRRMNHLCMYCGEPDHVVLECPVRPSIPFRPVHAHGATPAVAKPMGNDAAQLQ
jgi:hypothetical protein